MTAASDIRIEDREGRSLLGLAAIGIALVLIAAVCARTHDTIDWNFWVLLLVLSNALQNSMNGGDNSITGGMILAATLVGINSGVGWLTYRSKTIEGIIEGRPIILVHDGKIDHLALSQVQMTTHELEASLRAAGCAGPTDVRFAVLENTGKVSVIPMEHEGGKSGKMS